MYDQLAALVYLKPELFPRVFSTRISCNSTTLGMCEQGVHTINEEVSDKALSHNTWIFYGAQMEQIRHILGNYHRKLN